MNVATPTVYTIGHSNHTLVDFLALLEAQEVSLLADVRSYPASRWVPHFNKTPLESALTARGRAYGWWGKALGGKRDKPALLTAGGRPDFDKISKLHDFQAAIAALHAYISERRVALMCAEEDPMRCHRKHLVGNALSLRGVSVIHMRRDGSLIPDDQLTPPEPERAQLSLFD